MTDTVVDPALLLKITPPKLRRSLLARERLRQLPSRGEDRAVFIVEAPAGHGKTSLLAQWRLDWLQSGAAVAWLSLDAEDSPVTVVSGIVLGLRRSTGRPAFGRDALEAIRHGDDATLALTALLAEIAEMAVPIVLIFDNLERCREPAVIEVFDYLLHNLPPNLQLAVGSRPPAPLQTTDLLGHGILRRIASGDLRFELGETIQLLSSRLGDRVDADICARLHEVTEGWPLGLQLAATAIEQSADPARTIQSFSASRDEATRRLFDGILDALSPRTASLAVRCSLLDALHPSLCEAVTREEDAGLLLQRLLVETPLVTAAEGGEWLRFHPLAREFLRLRAHEILSEAERRELHDHAWRWLASHSFPASAARHALAAGNDDEALALVAGALNEEFEAGHAGTVMEWISRIPPAELDRDVRLRLIVLWMRVLGYTPGDALPSASSLAADPQVEEWAREEAILAGICVFLFSDRMGDARERLRALPAVATGLRSRRIIANVQAGLAIYAGAAEEGRRFLAGNPDDGRQPLVRIWGDYFAGLSYLWEGRPLLAEQVTRLQHARWESAVGRRGQWTCMLASLLAAACWQRNRHDDARELLANRLDVVEQAATPEGVVYAFRTLAQMAAADGDAARAFTYLEALASLGASRRIVRFIIVSLVERIRLHVCGGRLGQARMLLADLSQAFAGYEIDPGVEPSLRLEQALAQAIVAIASGDDREAGADLAVASTIAGRFNRGYEAVQVMALQALLLDRAGQSPKAMLVEAMSRAETGDLVRAFADTMPEVVELVRRLAQDASLAPVSRAFIDRVLGAATAAAAGVAKPVAPVPGGVLTPKEGDVLRLLACGMPNKRIATELGLSSETVKWHVKKLFAKLNAGSREHAVERARMLGLIG